MNTKPILAGTTGPGSVAGRTAITRISVLLPLLLLLALPVQTQAQFEYSISNGSVTIIKYTGPGGEVVIPDTINGLPVTTIRWGAFESPNVTSVTIPDSTTDIEVPQFRGCSNLVSISVSALNPVYRSVDGVLYDWSLTALIRCPRGKAGTYVIPPTVTSLGLESLYGCTGLSSVVIPESVTSIGWSAFAVCTGLTEITIPESVSSIGYYAFQYCTGLTGITIPDGVTRIEFAAFQACTGLTAVKIGEGVNTIDPLAFGGCTGLTSITIPDNVTTIGWEAFDNCSSLTHVWIGSGVSYIDGGAFDGVHLAAIDVDADNTAYSSLDGVLFNRDRTTLIQYPGLKVGGYAIPVTVLSIGGWAFHGCAGLSSITIPNGVTSIGPGAFTGCTSLTEIVIPDSVIAIDSFAFRGCSSLAAVYFEGDAPMLNGAGVFNGTSATIYYLQGTLGWGPTFGGRPTVALVPDSDGDGICDAEDCCPFSDLSETVVIGGWDSGAPNLWFTGGCTISDHIAKIAGGARNHGKFVSGVGKYLDELKKAGVISGAEKGAIQSCAAKAAIP